MEISLNLIKRTEYVQIFKLLSINELREPFINDNKLWKRRITGFGPQTVPINILSSAYFEEIKSGNTTMQRHLITLIKNYFTEREVLDIFGVITEFDDGLQWIDLGHKLSKANFLIPIELALKLCNIEVEARELNYIKYGFDLIEKEKAENEKRFASMLSSNQQLEAKISELVSKLDKANSKKLSLEEHLQEVKNLEERLKNENVGLLNKLSDSYALLQRVEKEMQEMKNENEKLHMLYKKCLEQISSLKGQLSESQNVIHDLNSRLVECNKERLYEYDTTIKRITMEVLEELNIELDITKQEFSELCNSLDGDLNLVNVWNVLFNKDSQLLSYIEDVMRSNRVMISDLDNLDELENDVVFKYIIIKSIKALFFEYLSISEKGANIADRFKNNTND